MDLFAIKYLFYIIFEGEKTISELIKDVGGSQSNVSHAMSVLNKFGLVTHPDKRARPWVADSSNELVQLMEKFIFVSGNNPEIKQIFNQKSIILIGSEFYKNKTGVTKENLIDSTKFSKVTVIKTLRKLAQFKIISIKVGRPNIYYPCKADLATIFLNACFLIQKVYNKKNELSPSEIIKQLENNVSVLILIHYGSSMRGTTDDFSDIDLFAVTRDKISRGDIISKYSNKKIDLNVYSKKGFLELLKSQPDFIRNLSTARILKGKDILEAVIK